MKYSKEEEFPSTVETLYSLVASKKVTGILGTEKVTLLENYDFVAFSLPLKLMSSWAVPKGFPLKEILNYHIQKLVENGVYKRVKHIEFENQKRKKKVKLKNKDVWHPIHIENIFLPISIFFFGAFASLFILIIELMYNKELNKV
ncbi:UNVERIFIED_CONTAM: hypothetical protein RMT77_007620 [Armadillidium vulgare]